MRDEPVDCPEISMTSQMPEVRDGFAGQRMQVLPRPLVRQASLLPGTTQLLVTDCGYFPNAVSHARTRTTPLAAAVIIVCTKGEGWCENGFGRFAVKSGQVAILPPGLAHSYAADPASPWTVWWLHVMGSDLAEILSAGQMSARAPVRNLSDPFRIVGLISEAIAWLERDSTPTSLLAASGAAWHLMSLLASERLVSDRGGVAIDQAVSYIREHAEDTIAISELATMARLSATHFAVQFKRRTGLPVLQYQSRVRMARARELLDTTELPIAAISAAIGYTDSFYFSRRFKNEHGESPAQYRKRHKG
jgi:AraC family transcriptional regulator of arabinose operon